MSSWGEVEDVVGSALLTGSMASIRTWELCGGVLLGQPLFCEKAVDGFTDALIWGGSIREGEKPAEAGKSLCGLDRILKVPRLISGAWIVRA